MSANNNYQQQNSKLINEAVKRILLDIVIRGHGDRLIGRWSRELELQNFLEQVPYMLDRINQLHLACTRVEAKELEHSHHHHHHHHHHYHHLHHHHHHHNHSNELEQEQENLPLGQTSLSDFVNLIGNDRHWLVRTRDTLGLTPLHKAVLHNNRPVAEYILDRYPEQMASVSWRNKSTSVAMNNNSNTSSNRHSSNLVTRLIDAQDKYGRTALHYAAANFKTISDPSATDLNGAHPKQQFIAGHLYNFLISKGASIAIQDFRGKTAAYYVRHANQLKSKSIIHLANKLNANYQANVLTKTLRASSRVAQISKAELPYKNSDVLLNENDFNTIDYGASSENSRELLPTNIDKEFDVEAEVPENNRESMSVSCTDLNKKQIPMNDNLVLLREKKNSVKKQSLDDGYNNELELLLLGEADGSDIKSKKTSCSYENNFKRSKSTIGFVDENYFPHINKENLPNKNNKSDNNMQQESIQSASSSTTLPIRTSDSPSSSLLTQSDLEQQFRNGQGTEKSYELALKQVHLDRLSSKQIIDQNCKDKVKRFLKEGNIDKINDLVVDGYGGFILDEAQIYCWNQQCKRFIRDILPSLLKKVDTLHDFIATNQLLASRTLLNNEPILARIKRPYRRASMGALHLAVLLDRRIIVKYLIEKFPELLIQKDSSGATCLHLAAKSLKHNRLYCWLIENYGTQLEYVRDNRNKTASDYRQQSIKLSSFEYNNNSNCNHSNQPTASYSKDVEDILREERINSNKLHFEGKKINLKLRRQQATGLEVKTRKAKQTNDGSRTISRVSNQSPVLIDENNNDDDNGKERHLSGVADEAQRNLDENCFHSNDNHISPTITKNTLPNSSRKRNSFQKIEFDEDDKKVNDTLKEQTSVQEMSDASSGTKTSDNLLGDLAQLVGYNDDLNLDEEKDNKQQQQQQQFVSSNNFTYQEENQNQNQRKNSYNHKTDEQNSNVELDSPLATPSLPISRPQSASTSGRLMNLIIESIHHCDYKKLEHFILAGCGQLVLKVYRSLIEEKLTKSENFIENSENTYDVGKDMRNYLEIELPNYMETIKRIHDLLHKCYSQTDASNIDLNLNFYKFCNQLYRKRLIMCRDSFGACPLHVALIRSDKRLIEYLLRRHPEAASAPDHDIRNSIHYAAIVLSAYKNHGPFKITLDGDHYLENESANFHCFWLVDENCETIYNNLCQRYSELIDIKDKKGKAAIDYLGSTSNVEHVNFCEYPAGLLDANILNNCCSEYSTLLSRYKYRIFITEMSNVSINNDTSLVMAEKNDYNTKEEINSNKDEQQVRKEEIETMKKKNMSKFEEREFIETRKSFDNLTTEKGNMKTSKLTKKTSTTSNSTKNLINSTNRSKTSDNLLKHLDGELPKPIVDEQTINIVRQIAPKQTVGSELSYPLSPTRLVSETGVKSMFTTTKNNKLKEVGEVFNYCDANKTQHQHHNSPSPNRDLLDNLNLNSNLHNNHNHNHHNHHHQHHHHHNRHNHHHHNRHHHRHRFHHVRRRPSTMTQSIVGGVIVPTIIHNDNRDEIETYDIIYRQPPASPINPASSDESRSSCSSSSSYSDDDNVKENDIIRKQKSLSPSYLSKHHHQHQHHHHDPMRSELNSEPKGWTPLDSDKSYNKAHKVDTTSISSKSSNSSASSSSSDSEIDDDDNRVERLSNEFENRVRKEKDELREKVDQIMNEIKVSAKTSKSTRFLSSPGDTHHSDEEKGASGGRGPSVMFALDNIDNNNERITSNKSLSSSGHSSACTSASSISSSSKSSYSSYSTAHTSQSNKSNYSTSKSTSSKCSSANRTTVVTSTNNNNINNNATQHIQNQNRLVTAINGKITTNSLPGQLISKNTYGQTYLHFIASRSQSPTTLYKVLLHGSYLIGERDIFYRTARDVALQFNLANNVQVLDKFIIDLFIEGNTNLLRHLLNEGYSPLIHVSDSDGNDIMLIMKLLKLDRMIHFLLQMADFQRWRDELHTFIRHGYSAGVSELIDKHKDLVRAKSVHSRTSLHLAVLFDRVEMVHELLEKDPTSVFSTDNLGRTALHYVYGINSKNMEEIRDKLLMYKANQDMRDVKMRTPKYYYIFKREIEDIKRIELELN